MKKVLTKPLRLTRQPIRVLTPRDLTRVEGGAPPTTSDTCTCPTGGGDHSDAQQGTCG